MISFFPSRAIAFSLGSFQVHWYGIMYAVGFILGMILLPKLCRMTKLALSEKERESLVFFMFLGVLLGGRMGYVLFYGSEYFVQNPLRVFAVWEGGMSSHGGFIGVALFVYYVARKTKTKFFQLTDTILIPVALGLALGRLGNLINGELYGTVTSLPWGMNFPDVDGLRHPTQIYAIVKNLLIAGCSYCTVQNYYKFEPIKSGMPTAVFLMMYAVLRFIVEIFRDQPYGYADIFGLELSQGQLLTLPLFVVGVILYIARNRRQVS